MVRRPSRIGHRTLVRRPREAHNANMTVTEAPRSPEVTERQRRWAVSVLAPYLGLDVTIEASPGDSRLDDVHLHPAGQGFWIARLLTRMGCDVQLVAPIGGEVGDVLCSLVRSWDVKLVSVPTRVSSACTIEDRRSGHRTLVAADRPREFHRHDSDQLYGTMLSTALSSELSVVTGLVDPHMLAIDFYRRLGNDLTSTSTRAIADLHGPELTAFLERGTLEILKLSDENLIKDGMIADDSVDSIISALRALSANRITMVVISMAERGAIAAFENQVFRVLPPVIGVVDPRGSGDSMTAALAAGVLRGHSPEALLQSACAAGAANATRHGLGTASPELISRLEGKVTVKRIGRLA